MCNHGNDTVRIITMVMIHEVCVTMVMIQGVCVTMITINNYEFNNAI
jgi:hypothetical protein